MGRLALWSFFGFSLGVGLYSLSALFWIFSGFTFMPQGLALVGWANWLFLISGTGALTEYIYAKCTQKPLELRQDPIKNPRISVGMTAYNDELSIAGAVKDFKAEERIVEVVVVDNNSRDKTKELASRAGAVVVNEEAQGYGAACIRALREARKKGNIVCLVEGDQTFFARDIAKLVPYIENVDMVVGTRTTMEIVSPNSQITTILRIGNLFGAKLLQLRYLGNVRLTDMGCTYRIIRPEALDKIIGELHVHGNHFAPHMVIAALQHNLRVIECPIAFRKRVGESKGVGTNLYKVLATGLDMLWLILTA